MSEKFTPREMAACDLGVLDFLLERLPQQAINVEQDGHVNAARYMRTACHLLENLRPYLQDALG